MHRKYEKDLEEWLHNPRKKPLVVYGARQVGKTYLIKNIFAETHFKNKYLYIDCSDDQAFTEFNLKHNSLDKLLQYLKIEHNFTPTSENLLIIDEVQECLPILRMLKQINELKNYMNVIVSGSLVRMKIKRKMKNKKFLFPVGKINQIIIYPLTFDEFLYNYSLDLYNIAYGSYKKKKVTDDYTHQKLLDVFYEYLFTGGLPDAVDTYFFYKKDPTKSYEEVSKTLKEIFTNYLNDMELYQTTPEMIIRTQNVFKNIYSQLNKENKNFKANSIEGVKNNRQLVTPIDWLETANVAFKASLTKEIVTSPITSDENLYRLYLNDMGLFTYQSKLSIPSFFVDKESALSGIYFENYLAIELVAHSFDLFYWKGKRNSEFEFLIEVNRRILPIDAKKSKGTIPSIKEFREHNKNDVLIKVSKNKYGYNSENKILTLPFYYFTFFLDEINSGLFPY